MIININKMNYIIETKKFNLALSNDCISQHRQLHTCKMFGLMKYGLLLFQPSTYYKQPNISKLHVLPLRFKDMKTPPHRESFKWFMNLDNNNDHLEEDDHHHNHVETSSSTNNNAEMMNDKKALSKIMNISLAHFKAQALHTFLKLKIPDILKVDEYMTIDEIVHQLKIKHVDRNKSIDSDNINVDALYRTIRFMKSLDIVNESYIDTTIDVINRNDSQKEFSERSCIQFQLTSFGKMFQQDKKEHTTTSKSTNFSSCILHWMEQPLNNAWYHLPDYILGTSMKKDPFEQANGISSDYFYNAQDNPQSLTYANELVKLISDLEVQSVVRCFDWSALEGKRIVDIGGYNGKVLGAIASHYPNHLKKTTTLMSLDLPNVISSIDKSKIPDGVQLISGDIMDSTTLPKCDVVFMKHFLDRCMWTEEETVTILKTCSEMIPDHEGMIILGEAVIPSAGTDFTTSSSSKVIDEMPLALDALYMLVGRERQRTEMEWKSLVKRAGLVLDEIIYTQSPSCYILVLKKSTDE